jgi:alpha-ketoglutaric semialdehyde dehydrogenase
MKFKDATSFEVDAALKEAYIAFLSVKNFSGKRKAIFLRAIADEIEALGQTLVTTAMKETALPEVRIVGERARTTGHLRMFADLVEEGSWVEARIDTAIPDRTPAPKPDLRKMLGPMGPVVVFGASNFPLAYSTAGGDTASALAAGCPVIVKAHPAHAETSELVAEAIQKAMKKNEMPAGIFQHLHGAEFEVGKALVQHPLTKAVGFTGSFAGGKALFDLANQRKEPIPVFAEMSSINPVILLPQSLARDAETTAAKLIPSITLNVGQFCTDPGLIIGIEDEGLERFIHALSEGIRNILPGTMLHQGIADNYSRKLKQALEQEAVNMEGQSAVEPEAGQGKAVVASTTAREFIKNPILGEEVFGPFSLVIRCKDSAELYSVVNHLRGQLTVTVISDESELLKHAGLVNIIKEKAGRLIFNGVPTGVEVCPPMQHGGPFPSTTDSRFTAVGTDAIKRFVKPVAFQNFPDALLPEELKASNPLGIWRLLNGKWGRE